MYEENRFRVCIFKFIAHNDSDGSAWRSRQRTTKTTTTDFGVYACIVRRFILNIENIKNQHFLTESIKATRIIIVWLLSSRR